MVLRDSTCAASDDDPKAFSNTFSADLLIVHYPFLDTLSDLVGAIEFRPESFLFILPAGAESLVKKITQFVE